MMLHEALAKLPCEGCGEAVHDQDHWCVASAAAYISEVADQAVATERDPNRGQFQIPMGADQ